MHCEAKQTKMPDLGAERGFLQGPAGPSRAKENPQTLELPQGFGCACLQAS